MSRKPHARKTKAAKSARRARGVSLDPVTLEVIGGASGFPIP